MPTRRHNGQTYQEVAVVAAEPLQVSGTFSAEPPVGGATEAKQDAQLTKMPSLVAGRVPVDMFVGARTPTTTSVASSATSVLILAANANRRGFSIANVSTSTLDLSFSNPATAGNCFIRLPAGAFILLDQQLIVTNAIYGIWASANGTAQVTEFV